MIWEFVKVLCFLSLYVVSVVTMRKLFKSRCLMMKTWYSDLMHCYQTVHVPICDGH